MDGSQNVSIAQSNTQLYLLFSLSAVIVSRRRLCQVSLCTSRREGWRRRRELAARRGTSTLQFAPSQVAELIREAISGAKCQKASGWAVSVSSSLSPPSACITSTQTEHDDRSASPSPSSSLPPSLPPTHHSNLSSHKLKSIPRKKNRTKQNKKSRSAAAGNGKAKMTHRSLGVM